MQHCYRDQDGLCIAHLKPPGQMLGFGVEVLDDHQGRGWGLALNIPQQASQ